MGVQYRGGCSVLRRMFNTVGDTISNVGNIICTVVEYNKYCGGYHQYCGGVQYILGFSILWGYNKYCRGDY